MNPLWFFVGLEIGERCERQLKTAVRETYWFIEGEVEKFRAGAAYRRWIDSLPTAKGGE